MTNSPEATKSACEPVIDSFALAVYKHRRDTPTSRKYAIFEKCMDCVGGPQPGWTQIVRDCQTTTCALHEFRQYK